MAESTNSFQSKAELKVGSKTYEIFRLKALEKTTKLNKLPYALRILLEHGSTLSKEDRQNILPITNNNQTFLDELMAIQER